MFLAATPSFVGSSTASAGPATTVDVTVGRAIATTGPNFVCWNLDASRNREFFDRNLSTALPLGARAARLAAALGRNQAAGHSLLRFGGSGNDYLRYEFGGVQCPPRTKYTECMNQSSWTDLLGFADAADARMIVGLSMQTGHDLRSHRKLDWLRLRAQHVPVEQRQRMLQQMRHNSTCEDAGCRQRMLQHLRHDARAGEHPPPPVLDGPSDPAADGQPTRRVGGPGFPFPWDPTEARHLLQWTKSRGLDRLIAGFELGNEQNIACAAAAHAIRARNFRAQFGAQFFRRAPLLPMILRYTATQAATNFAVLHNLTVELWPDASTRPPLYGPDPHSFHGMNTDRDKSALKYMVEWLDACARLGVPIVGVTHHEYIEVEPTAAGARNSGAILPNSV